MNVIVEIRAAEGGDDAKSLVIEQFVIYSKLAARRGLDVELVEERSGIIIFRAIGKTAHQVFQDEPGGHRWQRVPPNEKRGRVHTSTITVAVLSEPTETQVMLRDSDLDISTCRGSGAGGQHRNKTESAVVIKHLPTGITVRCENERSQAQNKETAKAALRARIYEVTQVALDGKRAFDRKQQLGSGMRGDKRRTIRVQDDAVNDHVTGRQWRYKAYVRGDWA